MGEAVGILIVLGIAGVVLVVAPLMALVAFFRVNRLNADIEELRGRITQLERRPAAAAAAVRATAPPQAARASAPPEPAAPVAPPPVVPPEPVLPPTIVTAPSPVEAPDLAPPAPAAVAPSVAPPPAAPTEPLPPRPRAPLPPRTPPPAAPPVADFATNLGPRLLVAAGAFAVIVFLGLFVKYAWENNWVGPAGRVLTGAVTGLALVVGGLRLLDREYRPLGQGLAGAGFAGLYLSAFAAHGFYQLVPRELAGFFMVAITASAVALSARLDTRLLAALAWLGGYLTPVLLSTGEDKAVALFLYLALLGGGALVLDHRRPWGETLPIAITGTVLLYAGWFDRFFAPEKFEIASFGLVLFTVMFALGAASKERRVLPVALVPLVTFGLAALADADRPFPLLVLSLGAATLAVVAGHTRGVHLAGLAVLPALVPLMAWGIGFYDDADLGVVAMWLIGTAIAMSVPVLFWRASQADEGPPTGAAAVSAFALALTGFGGAIMAGKTDRPAAILVFLLIYSAIAILADVRRRGVELVGAAGACLVVIGWAALFHGEGRGGDLLMLALPVWAVFLVQRVVRGTLGQAAGAAALFTQVVVATLAWSSLYNALYPDRASMLGLASVGLAACYLALGLAAWKRAEADDDDRRYLRVMLGLAATFLTIAIPVQLGLHGITLAWAFEGALLVVLGLRFGSGLTRLGGYGVLGLAVLRLLARHTPLHRDEFTPVFNATFGTWLLVILAIGFAARALRRAEDDLWSGEPVFRYGFATLALLLLFGLLTGETSAVFDHRERVAWLANDSEAASTAQFAGRMAVSVLWTVFATGLLASGLAIRSRPLFYSAYLLFAITGMKVMIVDLAGQHPLFRMLSFLALGLLLLVGAWLNIRFRERLAEPRAEAA